MYSWLESGITDTVQLQFDVCIAGVTQGMEQHSIVGQLFNKGNHYSNMDSDRCIRKTQQPVSNLVTVADDDNPVVTCPYAGNTNRYSDAGYALIHQWERNSIPTYNDNCPGSAIAYTLTGVTTGSGTSLVGVILIWVIPL